MFKRREMTKIVFQRLAHHLKNGPPLLVIGRVPSIQHVRQSRQGHLEMGIPFLCPDPDFLQTVHEVRIVPVLMPSWRYSKRRSGRWSSKKLAILNRSSVFILQDIVDPAGKIGDLTLRDTDLFAEFVHAGEMFYPRTRRSFPSRLKMKEPPSVWLPPRAFQYRSATVPTRGSSSERLLRVASMACFSEQMSPTWT